MQEERLEALIRQLEAYLKASGDYREWLAEQGIDTTGMSPMGSVKGHERVCQKVEKWTQLDGKRDMRHVTGLVVYLDKFGKMNRNRRNILLRR